MKKDLLQMYFVHNDCWQKIYCIVTSKNLWNSRKCEYVCKKVRQTFKGLVVIFLFFHNFARKHKPQISDRPKPEFKPKPKYRNFGLVWTDTETKTKRRSIPKPKPIPKPKFLFNKTSYLKWKKLFLWLLKQSTHNKEA